MTNSYDNKEEKNEIIKEQKNSNGMNNSNEEKNIFNLKSIFIVLLIVFGLGFILSNKK